MTERHENVEPPFSRRHVQLTVAVIASATIFWLLISSWSASPPSQHNRRLDFGESARAAAMDRPPLIQIDLNSAEPRELALLPRVGPVLAKRIFENRARLGPFLSIDDLRRVHGIGPKTLEEIQHICVAEPPPERQQSGQRLASARDLTDPDQ